MSDKYAPNLNLMVLMQQEIDVLKCQVDHMEEVVASSAKSLRLVREMFTVYETALNDVMRHLEIAMGGKGSALMSGTYNICLKAVRDINENYGDCYGLHDSSFEYEGDSDDELF